MSEVLTIVVKRVVFRNESGWCILHTDKGTCKGVVPWEPKECESIRVEGAWKTSEFNGKQEFVFKGASSELPENARSLLAFACEITKGIGPVTEDWLWNTWGEKWEENSMNPALDIPGMSHKARAAWDETLQKITIQRERAGMIGWILTLGGTINMAVAAYEKWGVGTLATIGENPYRLADLPNHGFKDCEKVRVALGIQDDDPRRVEAAILYVMENLAQAGDTAVEDVPLMGEVEKLIAGCDCHGVVVQLIEKGAIMRVGNSLALKRYYEAEKAIWEGE